MKYFIIAGEQSGDLHGSNLVRGIHSADKNAEIYCWGGDLMEEAGAKLLEPLQEDGLYGICSGCKEPWGHKKESVIYVKNRFLKLSLML